VAAVDRGFRHLHPFNSSILDGVHAATVWIDVSAATAYVASIGQCCAVVGRSDTGNAVQASGVFTVQCAVAKLVMTVIRQQVVSGRGE
jgi:hypothetical protein